MATALFDMLKLARRLEGAGQTREQAAGIAEALSDAFTGNVATKQDLDGVEMRLDAKIDRLDAKIDRVDARLARVLVTTVVAATGILGLLGIVLKFCPNG